MINGTIIDDPQTVTYALWLLELEYQIEDTEFKHYAVVNVALSYKEGPGPETIRGTVTTPEDPDGDEEQRFS